MTGTSPVTVRARVWAAGATKPGWQIQYSDNSSARITRAGSVAVRNYVEDADTTITLSTDDLSVGTAGAATGPPAPPSHGTARGSVPVGTASYPVPAGAVFVSRHGSDTNAGTESLPRSGPRAPLPCSFEPAAPSSCAKGCITSP